jgi:hypothetical protein
MAESYGSPLEVRFFYQVPEPPGGGYFMHQLD